MLTVELLAQARERILGEMRKAVIVSDRVIEEILVAILARGHCLLVCEPGCARMSLVYTLARTLSLSFSRIQHTHDLLPSDVTGTSQYPGPLLFANFILATDVNYAPPNTQDVLFEAMHKRTVLIDGVAHPLEQPFFVVADQNPNAPSVFWPYETHETYPLTATQLDRFLFTVRLAAPNLDDELNRARHCYPRDPEIERVLEREQVLEAQKLARQVRVPPDTFRYAARLVRATNPEERDAPAFIKESLASGAGPTATYSLIVAGKARAALRGRTLVSNEDVGAVAPAALRHRIALNASALRRGQTPDDVLSNLLEV